MPKTVFLPITCCRTCPHMKSETVYTADSWERPEKWLCSKQHGKLIHGYVEWNDKDESLPVPDWCPLTKETA